MNEQVEKILKKENFKVTDVIERSSRFFTAIGKLPRRKRNYFFKYTTEKDSSIFPSFRNEISTSIALQKGIRFKLTPRIISYKTGKDNYLIREFTQGHPLGCVHTVVSTYKNKNWKREYRRFNISSQQLDRIVYLLKRLHKIKIPEGLKCNTVSRWKKEIEPNLKIIGDRFDEKINFALKKIEEQAKSPYLCKYVCHGDFNLSNFIVYDGHIFVIDWEYTHMGNFGYDFVTLWYALWQKPKLQKKLFEKFIGSIKPEQEKEFWEMLEFNLAINAIKQLSHWIFSYSDFYHAKDLDCEPYYFLPTINDGLSYNLFILAVLQKDKAKSLMQGKKIKIKSEKFKL